MQSMQSFWCAARLMSRREALASHFLGLAGFEVYLPRLRASRTVRGRKVELRPPLFPGYAFVKILLQWHGARWCPGVAALIMDGVTPAKVPDGVIDEIRSRERNGLIELPRKPGLVPGERVRITAGPLIDHLGLYVGQSSHDRIAILLRLLGGQQRVGLPAGDVEAVAP